MAFAASRRPLGRARRFCPGGRADAGAMEVGALEKHVGALHRLLLLGPMLGANRSGERERGFLVRSGERQGGDC